MLRRNGRVGDVPKPVGAGRANHGVDVRFPAFVVGSIVAVAGLGPSSRFTNE